MKKIQLGTTGLEVPAIALGCMRMSGKSIDEAKEVIDRAVEEGINFFDHADIYGGGDSERVFAEAFAKTDLKREDIFLQSKVGIRKGFYDFSYDHITSSVDDILERLGTNYLDTLLLHRPDALMEPSEVARAFNDLYESGKVRHFGVSNHSPWQIELLKQSVKQDISINQLQLSVPHAGLISSGVNVNRHYHNPIHYTNEVLEYSRLNNMTIQPWSPVMGDNGVFLIDDQYEELNQTLDRLGKEYGVSRDTMAIAWLLRHPAKMQVVIGTMTPDRVTEYSKASSIEITRQQWYEIYRAAGHELP